MPAKKDYAVGRGKPPVHTQFRKGQSGNPGGQPHAAPGIRRRLREAMESALEEKPWRLKPSDAENVLQEIAIQMVKGAVRGERHAVKTFLELADQIDADRRQATADEGAPQATSAGAAGEVLTQASSLSEGSSEGKIEKPSEAADGVQAEQ
jgi:hypothetical protein